MKLHLTILTLLPSTLCAAIHSRDQTVQPEQEEPQHHPTDYKFDLLKSKHTLHHLLPSRPSPHHHQKRTSQLIPPIHLDPSIFLPPPWSPNSQLDSPYPLSGVPIINNNDDEFLPDLSITPYDDSGRAQMLDNIPGNGIQGVKWRTCPVGGLNCKRCPRDSRCRRMEGLPWWVGSTTTEQEQEQGDGRDDFENATTTPTDGEGGVQSQEMCSLLPCANEIGQVCGAGARCTRGYCVCDLGFKAVDNGGGAGPNSVVRGWEDLQSVTVWVDPGLACDTPCDTLSCKEVEQVEGCFDGGVAGQADEDEGREVGNGSEGDGSGMVETEGTHGGAIKAPGADVGGGGIAG